MPPPPRPLDLSSIKHNKIHQAPDTPTPSGSRAILPSSPLAHYARPGKPELGAAFEHVPATMEPASPESDFVTPATASSSPRKRRGSDDVELATSLTPVMKRQRFET